MEARFEIYLDVQDEWRFRLRAPNGETIAVSEGYSSKQNAEKGVEAVRRYAGDAPVKFIEPEEKIVSEKEEVIAEQQELPIEQPSQSESESPKGISYEWTPNKPGS